MKLNKMFRGYSSLEIKGLKSDSRSVEDGDLYYALKGFVTDGHKYIDQAIEKGAVAVVHSDDIEIKVDGVEYIKVSDVHSEMHRSSELFYDIDYSKLRIHAITGTNGKTTVSKTLYNMAREFGLNVGYIGTISIEYAEVFIESKLTTPDVLDLKKIHYDMLQAGVTDVFQEASSQGLHLGRLNTSKITTGSFTNLSNEHLDYHKDMESYFNAKKLLFENEECFTCNIINADDEYGRKLISTLKGKVCSYGINTKADYVAENIEYHDDGTSFDLVIGRDRYRMKTPFIAEFNVYNMLNVIVLLNQCLGLTIKNISNLFLGVKEVEGRMNRIDLGQSYQVYVDFAHTPDGVESVLKHFNSIVDKKSKIIVVTGSAGGRDSEKRTDIGRITTSLSSLSIFTEDDPRKETIRDISGDIVSGAVNKSWLMIDNRVEAIDQAIRIAREGDVVLILGKGTGKTMERHKGSSEWMGDHIIASKLIKTYM